jgi:hypothetical protein
MRAIRCSGQGRAGLDQSVARFQSSLTAACAGGSRAALLAGASIVALATFGAPSTASACSGLDQTIPNSVAGPIPGTGGVGFKLDLIIGTSGVQATILSIPKPSTLAMLATGFLGLAGLGLRSRRKRFG